MNENSEYHTELSEQEVIRRSKRETLIGMNIEPYPVQAQLTHAIEDIVKNYSHIQIGEYSDETICCGGRILFIRITGKLIFVSFQNGKGSSLQSMISQKEVGEEEFSRFKSFVDLGDIVSFTGPIMKSKRGELSVLVQEWGMLSKSLRPLPVLHKELSDENRVRERVADLITNPKARERAFLRPKILHSLRHYLHEQNFIEVETPMLQTLHGGAAARPFVTHSHALNADLFLRIAPELFLKRCIIGGFDKVFEINRNFRNEGVDATHSPEFAMLELYDVYSTYDDMAIKTRKLIQHVCHDVFGSLHVQLDDSTEYDFSGQWQSIDMYASLSEALGEEITPETENKKLRALAEKQDIHLEKPETVLHGKWVEELWENLVGSHIKVPFFVKDFPADTSPLTRGHRSKPGVSEKWDLYIRGFELATGYSELVDPVIQEENLRAQSLRAGIDVEAMNIDQDFLQSLSYGMPPCGGIGMGIDRLLMAFTGLGVKDTILFPLVKPK